MADALVTPVVAGGMYGCSALAMSYAIKKVALEDEERKIPLMGIMGAFVFAAQMINFTIPGTGSSGHLCGAMLLSAVVGPWAGFLTMIGVLFIQCVLFADGGLLALGCNIWNMAFYGCFVGALFIWQVVMKKGISRTKIILASILGCVLALQIGAFSVTLETLASGITALPFGMFVVTMQPIHLAIGIVEGIITAAVLCFIYEARPELLWYPQKDAMSSKQGKMAYKQVIGLLVVITIVIGGLGSLIASNHPDGLEWSIGKVAGTRELTTEGNIHEGAEKLQNTTAILPDYGFKESDSPLGTACSGLIGVTVVMGVCLLSGYLFQLYKRKTRE